MLGFLFGLMMGASLATSPQATLMANQIIAQIPIRCIAAFEQSEKDFRDCRALAITAELVNNSRGRGDETSICAMTWAGWRLQNYSAAMIGATKDWAKACDRDQALTWEVAALNALKNEMDRIEKLHRTTN